MKKTNGTASFKDGALAPSGGLGASALALVPSDWEYIRKQKRIQWKKNVNLRIWGLTRLLKRTFYPQFKYSSSSSSSQTSRTSSKKKKGKAQGKLVDKQITRRIQRPDSKKWKKEDPQVQVYFDFLKKQGYKCVAAQVGVGNSTWQLGSLVDVVLACVDQPDKGVVLIENKYFGSLELYFKGQHSKCTNSKTTQLVQTLIKDYFADIQKFTNKQPLTTIDAPFVQHQLQLVYLVDLFRTTFPTIPILGAMVLVIHPNGIARFPLLKLPPFKFLPSLGQR